MNGPLGTVYVSNRISNQHLIILWPDNVYGVGTKPINAASKLHTTDYIIVPTSGEYYCNCKNYGVFGKHFILATNMDTCSGQKLPHQLISQDLTSEHLVQLQSSFYNLKLSFYNIVLNECLCYAQNPYLNCQINENVHISVRRRRLAVK